MAVVPDHLEPMTGLTNSKIRFVGFDVVGSGASVCFEMIDKDGEPTGDLVVEVGPQPVATIDAMIAEAHRRLCDVLRQWLYETDQLRQAYERAER
jgi:hypothetical protein